EVPGQPHAGPRRARRPRPVGGQLVRVLRRPRHPADPRRAGRGALMDTLDLLANGFQAAFTPMNLLYAALGVLLGTFVGVVPGIGLAGMDLNAAQPRLSFGIPQLADRLDIVVIAVGIFALGEALWVAAHLRRRPMEVIPVGRPWMGRDDLKRSWKPWLRGTAF